MRSISNIPSIPGMTVRQVLQFVCVITDQVSTEDQCKSGQNQYGYPKLIPWSNSLFFTITLKKIENISFAIFIVFKFL